MLRLAKLTDYGTVIMTTLAQSDTRRSATDLAAATTLPADAAR